MSIQDIFQAILSFNGASVKNLVQTELDSGTDIDSILNEGLIGAMDEIGQRFSVGEIYVPEMLRAAKIMKEGLEVLKPHLVDGLTAAKGTVIIGTVKGDLHDIGKNLVAMMMEGAGFNLIDLGVDVDPDTFVTAAKEHKADVLALSALLSTTMPAMQDTINAFKAADLNTKVIIGGAPVTRTFADEIKADGYSEDAAGAVELARKLIAA